MHFTLPPTLKPGYGPAMIISQLFLNLVLSGVIARIDCLCMLII